MRRETEQEQVRREEAERERLERKTDIARCLEQAHRAQRDGDEQAGARRKPVPVAWRSAVIGLGAATA